MLAALLLQLASKNIDQILDDPKFKSAIIGVCVLDESGKELYARNADTRMIPASNQKLVTGAFALKALGPDFKPVTKFWKQRRALIVDSTGDPLMSYDELIQIRKQLDLRRNLDVRIHQAYGPIYPPGWEEDDLRNKYAAPVSAFTVDRGSFELWSDAGKLVYEPTPYGATATYAGGQGELNIDFDPRTMAATVTGSLSKDTVRLDTLAIGKPDFAAASIFGKNPSYTDTIPTTVPTFVQTGMALSEILKEDLPSSDNNISENLMLMGAGVTSKDRGPYTVAEQKVGEFLTSPVGLSADEFRIADGSGLSRHNVITARALAKLLLWADAQPTKELWHSCLAHPGQDGTLKNRLAGIPFEGKTGTMEMVSALSGYLHLKDGKTLAVAIMVNDYACSTAETRDLQDKVIKNLLDDGNEGTLIAESDKYERTRPHPRTGLAVGNRLYRSDRHGSAAPARIDPGDESDHADLHRSERVAVRRR